MAGATVVGPPPSRSPSLNEYPSCDDELRQMTAELWGDCDGIHVVENRLGEGKVIWGNQLPEVLEGLGLSPDFACYMEEVGAQIRYIHRKIDDKEVYFVASGCPEARRFRCTFRAKNSSPELWWLDTGRIEPTALYEATESGTTIPLNLGPYGSVFVVFRTGTGPSADRVVSVRRFSVEISGIPSTPMHELQLDKECPSIEMERGQGAGYLVEITQPGTYHLKTGSGHELKMAVPPLPGSLEIAGPWELAFPKGWGAPAQVTIERLISWTDHSDAGVRDFSGTATYRRRFNLPARLLVQDVRLYLDLGEVLVIAQARLNGRDLGVLWKPPFQVDITEAAIAGANSLEVDVVNVWPNRLVGNDHLPPDCE